MNEYEFHAHSNVSEQELVAQRLIESNKVIADTLVQASEATAQKLEQHNKNVGDINRDRFKNLRKWNKINISLNLATLIILIFFTIAFFHFAIIVRT